MKKRLLNENKVGNYLWYAVGEIMLIVIGILIAVAINNWNEENRREEVRKGIFSVIINDLKDDTTEVNRILDFYEERKPTFERVTSNTLSKKEVLNCNYCAGIITTRRLFTTNERGYTQLNNYQNVTAANEDSLIFNVIDFYSGMITRVEKFNNLIDDDIFNTTEYWRNEYSWLVGVIMERKLNDKALTYFGESQEYKNLVAHHYVIIFKNYVPILESFQQRAKVILEELNNRLDSE